MTGPAWARPWASGRAASPAAARPRRVMLWGMRRSSRLFSFRREHAGEGPVWEQPRPVRGRVLLRLEAAPLRRIRRAPEIPGGDAAPGRPGLADRGPLL